MGGSNISEKPDFLPSSFWSIYLSMEKCNKLDAKRASFFTDNRMKSFWKCIDKHDLSHSYVETFTGSIFNPLGVFDQIGTRESPSTKTNILDQQAKANALMDKISKLSAKLQENINELLSLQAMYPAELHLHEIIENLELDSELQITSLSSSSPYYSVTVADVLLQLETAINDFPRSAIELYPFIPALHSSKSSKLDYLRDIFGLLDSLCTKPYWRKLGIREVDWVSFYKVMVDDGDAARDAVKKVLKEINYSCTV